MSEANEQIILDFLTKWSTRDAEGMAAAFAEDGVYDNVPDEKPMVGREAILTWLNQCLGVLSQIDVEMLNISSNGEWVLNERIDDHIVGDKHMPLPVMNASRIVDGKIVMFRDYYCRVTVKELGMG
ncbi:MAG: limonene-1,2-epoxide hydrolase family protein [Novosphingobium sp.]|nr:limonene-1,2-epoxide hydrolase family protein [Novosphingobium sp.]